MNNKEIYSRLMDAAVTEMNDWRKANKLTPIEQIDNYMPVLSGIARAALFLLPTDDYFRFTSELRDKGGIF